MTTHEIQKLVYHGCGRVFDEVMDSGKAGRMGGYFYREFPRYSGGRYNAAGCPFSNEGKNDEDEEVVALKIVHECTGLEVIMGKRMLRAWNGLTRSTRVEHAWLCLCGELCEMHKVSTRYQGLFSGSASSEGRLGAGLPASEGRALIKLAAGRGLNKPCKVRVVFSGNNVGWGDSPHAMLPEYAAEPVTLLSPCMMDLWTSVPESYNRRAPMYVKWVYRRV